MIKVTLEHIRAAKPMPNTSPIALALREMGYENASVTHRYAYFNQDVYQLPPIATENEIRFDMGKAIKPYEFELGEKINVA